MATTTGNRNRVWFIVRGMTSYVSRIYKSEKYGIQSSDIAEEDLSLPNRLKIVLSDSLDRLKDERYVTAHNHCVRMENRVDHLTKSFRTGILELAKTHPHDTFLHECTLYILSATEVARLNFHEAIDIVMDAIYYACINTSQHESLMQWGTPQEMRENIANNGLNNRDIQHNNEEQHKNDAQLGNYAQKNIDILYTEINLCSSDIEILVGKKFKNYLTFN